MLHDRRLPDLFDAFASSDPTPGGGSAAALQGALGASLLAMVAGVPKTKSNLPEERAALDDARGRLLHLRQTLMNLIDRDAGAYDLVVRAYKRPKSTDEEKLERKAAVQDALKYATEVPLETLQAIVEALEIAQRVAEQGNPSAASDVAVAAHALMSGLQGAWLNVAVNLDSVTDEAFVESTVRAVRDRLEVSGAAIGAIWQAPSLHDLLARATARFK